MEKNKLFLIKRKEKVHKFLRMRAYRKKKLKGILIVLSVIMIVVSINYKSSASEINQANEEKTDLEQKKKDTEVRLKDLEKEKDDILKYIEKLDIELSILAVEVNDLNKDIEKTNEELVIARDELELARLTEEKQYATMKKRIQYMYEKGETNYLELILQSDNISDMLNQIEYMSKITEYDNGLLDEYKSTKQDVTEKEERLEVKISELNELKEELIFEQETIEHLVKDKNTELVKYQESIDETQDLSAEYSMKLEDQEKLIEDLLEAEMKRIEEEEKKRKAEEERIRKEEERIRKEEEERIKNEQGQNQPEEEDDDAPQDSNPVKVEIDGFIWPVPASSRITSTFGYRDQPTAGASTYHKGLDIGASTGTEIVAAAGGTVVTAAYSVSAGNYIMISHGNSIYTVYMHCSKLLVSVGNQVSQGETIALVGSTGVSTGPHLHFGVSVNGAYVDPQLYVSY